MKFEVVTLFPEMFDSPFAGSIIGKAVAKGLVQITAHPLRDWAEGRHQVTDDTPYGGGDGMVMKPEPLCRAIQSLKQQHPRARVLMMSPQGQRFTQQRAAQLAEEESLIFLCGRYEGFDERVRSYVDEEYSIGDFVLTGGELPAMVIIDAVARLVPGVLGSQGSAEADSFSDGLLEHPHYTRPAEFEGRKVPEVLLSGDHARIAAWRRSQQLLRTLQRRPDLLEHVSLTEQDRVELEQHRQMLRQEKKDK
ncbi:tRNA (guanosine(37)-N1)-methyltransferase TrmD [Desulfuromonas acetoxidans]|uniref:tRNA (guanine-N(1)-)-methyltransferase n=1 Tax=Desulfuromonas acetoxidans (strain DSM 684 / 11070) TaxID=281689 RepID=Q1JX95_DESA6|nr:tRNA (guanosine(37)-N1)-methyltransferase TrmD [Desulfuromonas acetoxidans]EAT14897.1 tRNA (guanine-N1)-methyltransferase [Desulfuromonas acetoxidans DSM 684]MBF0645554.1 tRNA (guanosine(37)-N1)-methyltransferase TrmD [Desulfuromonas acetoxidans]NVD23356.1 tRNA (guanosine(37)-N1)-methyltransferase TrmD [Desulfuromonas acetoxidans]NVE15403.1 tRNA (guanosine(37)-N1)-methyltransferase TrmD [Desulfuromonas acetoxidans]